MRLPSAVRLGFLCALAAAALAAGAAAAESRYATTPVVEPDRCATAWTIQRFLDPGARFEFHDEGAFPEGVIPFDLPDAALRRDARRAMLEVLIEREGLDDPFLRTLAGLVHEIEIRAWAQAPDSPSRRFEQLVAALTRDAPDPATALRACFELLDVMRYAAEASRAPGSP